MSATLAGGFKAALEQAGLGLAFYRDEAPPDTPLPYGVLTELPAVAEPSGDFGDPNGVPMELRQQVQIDVWEPHRSNAGAVAEDYLLGPRVAKAVRGLRLLTAVGEGQAYPAVLRDYRRIGPDQTLSGPNLVRTILTAEVVRTL